MNRVNELFSLEEQIDLLWSLGKIKSDFEKEKVPLKRQCYFKKFAEEYRLADRMKIFLSIYSDQIEIPTSEDIANLFEVHRSTVIRYFQDNFDKEDLKYYKSLCREQGSRRGGANSSTLGYTQKRTWSRKKK